MLSSHLHWKPALTAFSVTAPIMHLQTGRLVIDFNKKQSLDAVLIHQKCIFAPAPEKRFGLSDCLFILDEAAP